jgi:hypothetical protein
MTVVHKQGSSLVESCVVILLLCMVLFGVLQASRLFMAKEVLDYAAVCGARAATVGLNEHMVRKSVRVAAIPNAGDLLTGVPDSPDVAAWTRADGPLHHLGSKWDAAVSGSPRASHYWTERIRIPAYLQETRPGRSRGILDYEDWPEINISQVQTSDELLTVNVKQNYGLDFPLSRWIFSGASEFRLRSSMLLEDHAALYLE